MRTQLMIMLIVTTVFLAAVAILFGLAAWFGWPTGVLVWLLLGLVVAGLYWRLVKPWHIRWGATDLEVTQPMPGDEIIPGAKAATRAITIDRPPEEVWPWLVQIGFGKAGWYSYDWIDNDFKPSADRILPEYQSLSAGDEILMMPTMGFVVQVVDRPHSIVSLLEDGSTSWCLALYPTAEGATRLVSRWRPKFERTPATFLMTMLAEPGTFIMEQKMLRTIRDRVESTAVAEVVR